MRRKSWGLVVLALASACVSDGRDVALERAPDVQVADEADSVRADGARRSTPRPPTETVAVETERTPTTPAPTTTAPPPPEIEGAWSTEPYLGFGAWLDTYDWSALSSDTGVPAAGPEVVDHMAAEGVETLYIQASRWNSPTDVLEQERLQAFIDRAHHHGIAVVAWYLPTLEDPATDLRRMLAIAELDVDGLGVDIEATDVADIAERNRRLIDLSKQLREALPGKALGAIVLEPVLIEDVNANYWPHFPWAELAPLYDVWLPMSYWTNRVGEWRSAHTYTATNIVRVRERIGDPAALVHTIGGIGDKTTVDDLHAMVAAAGEHGAIGGSIYDYRTSRAEFWEILRAFRRS